MAKKKLVLSSKAAVKDAVVIKKKVVAKKASAPKRQVKDKVITITLAEGKRGTATFSSNVRGHDVDVAGMRLKRMYRVYREQQRRELEQQPK